MIQNFHDVLKQKIHAFITLVYDFTKIFPKTEMFGATSQIRRAAVSIMLNYVEGFGRRKEKVQLNFYETSYGSLQETKYILFLALTQRWMTKNDYESATMLADEIGKMLWGTIRGLEKRIG